MDPQKNPRSSPPTATTTNTTVDESAATEVNGQDRMDSINSELKEVKGQIASVETKIASIETKIESTEQEIVDAKTKVEGANLPPLEVEYWMNEVKQLRDEKMQLCEEKKQLREEKKQLCVEKKQLHDEKKRLRDEKINELCGIVKKKQPVHNVQQPALRNGAQKRAQDFLEVIRSNEEDTPNSKDDPLVELSVSGTSFTLRKETITGNDWMLAKIVESEIPWALYHNGRYFIDADPISFRWVLHFTRYQTLPTHITKEVGELEVIRSLADFLCFEPLVAYLDEAIASCVKIQSKVEDELILKTDAGGRTPPTTPGNGALQPGVVGAHILCPAKHVAGFIWSSRCNACDKRVETGELMSACRECDWHACLACVTAARNRFWS